MDRFLGGASLIADPWEVFDQSISSWWRSTVGVTTSGSNITSVTDQGGMARNLTGISGAEPQLLTDSNGRNYFGFTNNGFTFNGSSYRGSASDYQLIIVFQSDDTAVPQSAEKRFLNGASGTRITANYNVNGSAMPPSYGQASNVSAFKKSKQGYIPGQLHIIRYDFSEPNQRIYINGVENSNTNTVAYTKQVLNMITATIGRTAGGSTLNIIGRVYEILLAPGTYTDSDKSRVDAWFLNQYSAYSKTAFLPNGKSVSLVSETKIVDTTGSPSTDDYIFSCLCSLDSSERLHITYTRGENHNNNANQKLIYRYTDDYGSNVSAEQTILTSNSNTRYTTSQAFRTQSGRILLSYTTINYVAGTFFANMKYSDNDGSSWSDITGDGADGLITTYYGPPGYIVGVGNMIQLDNGDLLHVLYGRAAGSGNREVIVFKSTDDGDTWDFFSKIAPPTARDYEETCIYKGRTGLLMALMRSDQADTAYVSYSWDNGATWIFGPSSIADRPSGYTSVGYNGAAMSPSGGVLAFGRNNDVAGRTRIHYSQDGGYSFSTANQSSRDVFYHYGQFQWSNALGQFIGVHAEENVSAPVGLGPCSVFITRYSES